MALDVNKIIMQSLGEVVTIEPVTEITIGHLLMGAGLGLTYGGNRLVNKLTTEDEAKEDLKSKVVGAGKNAVEDAKNVVDEAKEKASGVSVKVAEIMNDHPGISAAAAAALAAGVGGLVLRKKLKAARKNEED